MPESSSLSMQRLLRLTHAPIDETALAADSAPANATTTGAIVRFLGIVRGSEDGRPIRALEYTAFEAMAEHQFHRIFDAAATRWPQLEGIRLVHRLGVVPAGEPSLWVELTAPHRGEAFAACQWIVDEMKRVVPIWKRALT